MEKKFCCIVKPYVDCGECEDRWCYECWMNEYYTRDHNFDDVQMTVGWRRVFLCPNTDKWVMLGEGNRTFTEAAYLEVKKK